MNPQLNAMGSMMTSMTGLTERDLRVEHRLTKLEQFAEHQRGANTKMDNRQTLQERVLLVLFISVTALAHERIPWLAKVLIGFVKTAAL